MNSNFGSYKPPKDYEPLSSEDDVEIAPRQGQFIRIINAPRQGQFKRIIETGATNSEELFENDPQIDAADQSHIYFCGCCCDFRRAILSLSLGSIIFRLLIMILVFVLNLIVDKKQEEFRATYGDDGFSFEYEQTDELRHFLEIILEVCLSVIIIFDAIGIYGALKFKRWAIITSMSFYIFALVVCVFTLDLLDGILYCLFVYAYVGMLILMNKGIMTDINYHKIAGCCGKI